MHPRKLEAAARAEAKKTEQRSAQEKAREEARWADNDKTIQAKLSREASREAKQAEEARKKEEKKEIIAREEAIMTGYSNKKGLTSVKINRADIRISALNHIAVKPSKKKETQTIHDVRLLPNMNRADQELLAAGGEIVDARGLDQALSVLKIVDEEVDQDKHPEKRQRAAYSAFEAERLPQLKGEFPTLKFTQLKEKLQKEWKKHPDNPMLERDGK